MWGYLDENRQVVRCGIAELLERCRGRDPLGPDAMQRRVGSDLVRGQYWVSTVFLGIEHGWGSASHWFETMVFHRDSMRGEYYQNRYETYDEALLGHKQALLDGLNRQGWSRWLGYSRSHLRKIRRAQLAAVMS